MAGSRHRGPYEQISERLVDLFPWAVALGLTSEHVAAATHVVAYYGDSIQTPPDEVRSRAAVTATEDAASADWPKTACRAPTPGDLPGFPLSAR